MKDSISITRSAWSPCNCGVFACRDVGDGVACQGIGDALAYQGIGDAFAYQGIGGRVGVK